MKLDHFFKKVLCLFVSQGLYNVQFQFFHLQDFYNLQTEIEFYLMLCNKESTYRSE